MDGTLVVRTLPDPSRERQGPLHTNRPRADFLGVGLDQAPPDHSTISRTRRLIALETHRAVFTWVLQCLSTAGLVKGKTIGIDATTLEANAALRSIVRRDSGESYEEFLTTPARPLGSVRRLNTFVACR